MFKDNNDEYNDNNNKKMTDIPSIDEDDAAVGFTELTIVTNLFFELSKDDNDDDCLFVVVITLNEYDNTHIEMINNRILIDFDMIYYYYLLLL